ncbi:hypothetical protein Aduo_015652 [Ancylostoma duodenale]
MHMNLREFLCNSAVVNSAISPSDRIRNASSVKLLGIPWKPDLDTLVIPLKIVHQPVSTKRTALRALSSTFDPLGLLVPFLAPFKVFIQDTWKKKYQWDDPFDKEDLLRWNLLIQDLEDPLPVVEIRSIVSALQSSGTHVKFYYVQPEQNPADCASRGLSTKFARNHIWWCGPSLLLLPSSEWPNADCKFNLPPDISAEVEDEFQVHNAVQVYSYQSPLRFQATNRYLKLVRSTAYVLKFIGALLLKTRHRPSSLNLSHSLLTKLINAEEFTIAETLLITEHYRESEHQLKELPLHRFNVHRSADRHFRCPHRLEHAETSTISAAPILLVPAHPLTTTVVMHHHLDNFHSGVHATIASLRRRFFIPSIRSTVVKILRDRIVCKKANCLPYRYPDMPSLPSERVTRSRPFQKVGLDYLGPLHYRDAFNTKAKVWVCLFTCMATRAVHLELVLNNSTQEFLLALRRFIARRGTPDHILSDNATTFVSANDVMNDVIFSSSSVEKLTNELANRKIVWKFTTPLSPWKGGFYERLVGLLKSAFRKSVGRALLPLQQFQTLVCEIEAVQLSSSVIYSGYLFHRLSNRRQAFLATVLLIGTKQPSPCSIISGIFGIRITRPPLQTAIKNVSVKDTTAISALVPRSATVRMPNGRILQRSLSHLYPLEITAFEDQTESMEREQRLPTRVQPARAAKRIRSYSR